MRNGKVRTYERVEKMYQPLVSLFGVAEISEDLVHRIEEFVCDLDGKPKLKKLVDARYALFRQRYAPTKDNDLLS